MPKPYPTESGDDVARIARNRKPGMAIGQIAKDLGVHPMTVQKCLHRTESEEGAKPGISRAEADEIREVHMRNRLLDQENELSRWAAARLLQANPPGEGSARSRRSSPKQAFL